MKPTLFLLSIFQSFSSSLNPLLECTTLFPCSYSLLLLSVVHLIFNLSTPRFAICPHLLPLFSFLSSHFLCHHEHPSLCWLASAKILDFFQACLSLPIFNMATLSLAPLPITQNLIFLCWFRFCFHSFSTNSMTWTGATYPNDT